MTAPAHNPCATCGACCRSYIVPVCGYDVWLISTRQRLSPEEFLIAGPQDSPRPDGFRLDRGGPTYGLALDKRRPLRVTQPCVFLIQLGGGNDRCGIYDERPVVCRSYPMSMWKDVVSQREDALCPSGSWSEADVAVSSWRDALRELRVHFDIYYEVVARWNARMAAQAPTAQFELPEYLSYLLNIYDRLAALGDDMAVRARPIINGFYPEIPPEPFIPVPSGEAAIPTGDRRGAGRMPA